MAFTIGRGNDIVSRTAYAVPRSPDPILRSVKPSQRWQTSSLVVIQRIFSRVWERLGIGCLLIHNYGGEYHRLQALDLVF